MTDNDGHFIDDPLGIVNAKPDFEGIGYASTADFEPKNIDEFLDHEREYIKNTPLSKEPYFKDVAESLNNKEL